MIIFIVSSNKIPNRVLLRGEGNAGKRWKTTVSLISKKSNFARVAHFFVHFLPLFCTTTMWNFQKRFSYTFLGGNVVRVLVHFFFSLPLIFTLHWWPLSFLILSPPLQNFHAVLPTKKCLLFFISHARSLSPFFSLSFADLPLIFSTSLSFSCSIFQICGHDS